MKKRKKRQEPVDYVLSASETKKHNNFDKGIPNIKDLLAPCGIDRSNESFLKVGEKFVRNFVLTGFPKNIGVGWLDYVINNNEDVDTAIYINPTDERSALDELTDKITQFESQLSIELEKGSNRNLTRLRNKIDELYRQRELVEQNYVSLFYIQVAINLYMNSKEGLDKQSNLMDNILIGRKIKAMPTFLQQDDGYRTGLPFGKSYLPGMFRNFSSDALTACFPFYNAELSHKTGVFLGVNMATATPIYIDFYDRNILGNGNLTVFGKAGSGKTFLVSLLCMRSALQQVRTVIVDPEGEYSKLTRALGGSVINIAPQSNNFINPFDIEEEDILDDDGLLVGGKEIKIKEKVADLLNLIGVMAGGLDSEVKALVSYAISDLYSDRGITEDPESLYESGSAFDKERKEFIQTGKKKSMPTFSDFHARLLSQEDSSGKLKTLANTLSMFKKGGVYDLFDCQTSEHLRSFKDAPIVSFDVSKLEESVLRPIGMYIALSWTWEKFVKKNPTVKKRVVCDEAWMLVSRNMAGYEYTSQFLETAARRIRKRNGGLLVASQNFREFTDSPQGRAVLSNAAANIFLKQDSSDIDAVQDTFKLSDGERSFLYSANRGEFLLRVEGESTVGYAKAFEFERELIEKAYTSKD